MRRPPGPCYPRLGPGHTALLAVEIQPRNEPMSTDVFDLTGQVAVITGGGTGIGRATARVLAEHGADVVLASRREENLEQTAADDQRARTPRRRQEDGRTQARRLSSPDRGCARGVRKDRHPRQQRGRQQGTFPSTNGPSRSSRTPSLSTCGASSSCPNRLCATWSSSTAATSSTSPPSRASTAMPGLGPYGMAKAGVNNLTRFLAAKYGADNIRVNCVAPGFVGSDGFRPRHAGRRQRSGRRRRAVERNGPGRSPGGDRPADSVPGLPGLQLLVRGDDLRRRRTARRRPLALSAIAQSMARTWTATKAGSPETIPPALTAAASRAPGAWRGPRPATKLLHQLEHLAQPGCADRVAPSTRARRSD